MLSRELGWEPEIVWLVSRSADWMEEREMVKNETYNAVESGSVQPATNHVTVGSH